MTRYYSTTDAVIEATRLGHTIGQRELSRQAHRAGVRVGRHWFYTHAQLVKFLEVTRRNRGHQPKPKPKSVTTDLDPESDEAKELLSLLEDMTNDLPS